MEVSWDGPDPVDRGTCPYSVEFQCRPAPAEALNSPESGRLFLQVDLGREVKSVTARIVNNAKRERLIATENPSELEHKTSLSIRLVRDSGRSERWAGELSIPSSWMEGGTRTFERTGSAIPKSDRKIYTLEIKYDLESGNRCKARFSSEDAFHWQPRPKVEA